jgi:hypothetical protein
VQGLGEIPSFKNKKQIGRSFKKKAVLFTKPKVKQQMERITRAIECRLRSSFLTVGIAMGTECIPLSRIVSSLPLDDSLAWIPEHSVNWRRVNKGEEGFELTIEKIGIETPPK